MSYWKSYRAANKILHGHLNNIELGEHHDVTLPTEEDGMSNAESGIADPATEDEDDSVVPEDCEFGDLAAAASMSSDGDISSDDEEGFGGTENIVAELAQWAAEEQISHKALSHLLMILHEKIEGLPKDPRTLLQSSNVNVSKSIQQIAGGEYYHMGLRNKIVSTLSTCPILRTFAVIDLQLNVDGLSLFKSSNKQFWPILGMLPQVENHEPFLIGLFYGVKKPNDVTEYLQSLIRECEDLEANQIVFAGNTYTINIANFICDAPARAFVKCTVQHSGYHACERCTQRGVYNHKMTFPEVDAPVRTNISFDEMSDEGHHKGETPLRRLSLGMVTQFPLDYMHLVCLGVTKRLILLWMRGPLRCRFGSTTINRISECLVSFIKHIPKEFSRKPRSLTEVDRWKATEFRLFLLYTGPLALRNKMSEEIYKNFMLFSVAINILLNPTICVLYVDYAKEILTCFVKHFAQLYGPEMLVYNVHNLVHLADDVKVNNCSLDHFSAFPFETFLYKLRKMVRKPRYALQQVILRLMESANSSNQQVTELESSFEFKKEHTSGPIPRGFHDNVYTQFGELRKQNFCISLTAADNCVKIGTDICIIRNIIKTGRSTYVVYSRFLSKSAFFTYPLNSMQLDICKVSNVEMQIHAANVNLIHCKLMRLPYGNESVVMPILHTS